MVSVRDGGLEIGFCRSRSWSRNPVVSVLGVGGLDYCAGLGVETGKILSLRILGDILVILDVTVKTVFRINIELYH